MISGTRGTRGRPGAVWGSETLMARMGHDSERAAIIYQHEARGADAAITDAIDAHVESEQGKGGDDGGTSGAVVHASTGTLMARGRLRDFYGPASGIGVSR
jgi:hypothetical protein